MLPSSRRYLGVFARSRAHVVEYGCETADVWGNLRRFFLFQNLGYGQTAGNEQIRNTKTSKPTNWDVGRMYRDRSAIRIFMMFRGLLHSIERSGIGGGNHYSGYGGQVEFYPAQAVRCDEIPLDVAHLPQYVVVGYCAWKEGIR